MSFVTRLFPILLVSVFTAACQTAPERPAPGEKAQYSFPDEAYQQDARQDGTLFRVDAAASEVRILVYRGGTLASAGHNHVVVPGRMRGALWLPDGGVSGSQLDIVVPLDELQVDPPGARQAVGGSFGGTLQADAREGTRQNMLGPDGLNAAAVR